MNRHSCTLALCVAFGFACSVYADDPKPGEDPAAPAIVLLDQHFQVDETARVLPAARERKITVADVSERLNEVLTGNESFFARVESIRRAAIHIVRSEDEALRQAEARHVLGLLKARYVRLGGELGRAVKDTSLSPLDSSAARVVAADKVEASVQSRAFARSDLAYGVALLTSAKLVGEGDLGEVRACHVYIDEAMAIQPMAELSFGAALLWCAQDAHLAGKEPTATAEQRATTFRRHLKHAIEASVPGDLVDRNLASCYGADTIKRLRVATPLHDDLPGKGER